MIRVQDNLQEDMRDWHDFQGKYEDYRGDVGAAKHHSGRSSYCSTCSSYDSDDSDDDDSVSKWPWIRYIQDDGSLFYLGSFFDPPSDNEAENEWSRKGSGKEGKKDEPSGILRGFGRIKGALKRNATFAKKEKEGEKNGESTKEDLQNVNESMDKIPPVLSGALYDVQIIRKTTIVKVNKRLPPDKGMNSNLLHDILGIISGLDLDPVQPETSLMDKTAIPRRLDAIAIQGIAHGSPVDANQDINIDDTLLAINGVEVSERNINYVLSTIRWPAEIVLTIEKVVHVPAKPKLQSKLIDLMTGDIDDEKNLTAYQEDCAVMCLTLDGNDNDPEGDILFWYPENQRSGRLKDIRGMFLTLSDLMPSVTGTEIKSSTLLVCEKIIHVCYQKVGKNVLVVAAPDSRCSLSRLEEAVKELMRQMAFLYQSAEKAFESEYKEDVRYSFVLFMERLLGGLPVKSKSEVSNLTADNLNGVKYLQLSPEKHVSISNVLSDAEAADYGDYADDFFPHRRLYTNIGSSLFYKGNLVCNHLPNDDLIDSMVFCKHHCLLAMTEAQRVDEVVVWKEVYPYRRREDGESESGCFDEPTGRWFLLVVAKKHSLLCTLLETGGASSSPVRSPGPHPYYVEKAASILAYIQEKLDFETICEAKLRGSSVPAIASVKDITNSRHNSHNSHLEITLRKLPAHLETMAMESSQSMDSLRSVANPGEESPRQNSKKSSSPYLRRFSETRTSDDSGSNSSSLKMSVSSYPSVSSPYKSNQIPYSEHTSMISTKLTAGASNTLFYYTMCDKAKGILLCPTASCSDMVNKEVLDNFYKACELIRRTFNRDCGKKAYGEEKAMNDLNMDKVYEQGLLFRRKPSKGGDSKRTQNVLKYWVVGRRLLDATREFFVCFHDGLPQSVIELAFKFGFGTVI